GDAPPRRPAARSEAGLAEGVPGREESRRSQRGGDHRRSREPDRDLGVCTLALGARLHGGLVRLHDRSALRAPARQARGDPRAGRARRRRARRAPAEVSGARVTAVGVRSEEAERAAALAFDLRALPDDFYADPFPAYHRLRRWDPVHRCPDGTYFLTRYDDVVAVYADH